MDKLRFFILRIIQCILIIYFGLIGYVKLKNPFWSRQPIFHFYNLYYWIKPNQIIEEDLIKIDKFYDDDIYFEEFEKISTEKKDMFIDFIKNNYLTDEKEKYTPTKESITDIFTGHNEKSFISLKIYNNKILSSIISNPLYFKYGDKKLKAHYADFLCVDKIHRNKMYAAKQAYTHYYHGRKNTNNDIVLFKRENKSNFIVPFTVYNNYIFKIDNWKSCFTFEQPNITVVFVNKSNMNKFFSIYEKSKKKFKYFISFNLGNIFNMIFNHHMVITCLMVNEIFVSYYVFKNPYTTYYDVKSLEFCSSYKDDNIDDNSFVLGYMISQSLVSKDLDTKIVLIENLANNDIIINKLMTKYAYFAKTINSLYLYNFACYPKYSNEIMCII